MGSGSSGMWAENGSNAAKPVSPCGAVLSYRVVLSVSGKWTASVTAAKSSGAALASVATGRPGSAGLGSTQLLQSAVSTRAQPKATRRMCSAKLLAFTVHGPLQPTGGCCAGGDEWSQSRSNRLPPACEAGASPAISSTERPTGPGASYKTCAPTAARSAVVAARRAVREDPPVAEL